ncbi:PAS domain S-box protein [Mucilaginibacter litoreus]|uniref:histidine kinase n=1 Tax=Mucilaginibacter litoreus TaxID=1048221 RepID=A0ABW3AR76_9SPHI
MSSVDEKLFNLLVSSVKDYAIFMVDINGYILSWNQGAENIKGYKADEVIGRHLSIFYQPNDNERLQLRHNLNQALKNGTYKCEGWRVRKDGTAFWASVVFTTIYNEAGLLTGFAKVTRDITLQKEQEIKSAQLNAELEKRVKENTSKIIANEVRFRHLIENSYDGYTLFDENLKVVYRSRSSERINGWTYTDREAEDIWNILHPDDIAMMRMQLPQLLSSYGKPFIAVCRVKHKEGHYIWLECVFTNMLNDEHIRGVICNFRDITSQKEVEAEREKITSDLVQRNQDLEQFAYMISHNLRAPVANILGLTQILDYTGTQEEDTRPALQALTQSVKHLDQVIIDMNNILQVGSIANEKYEPVYLSEVVSSILESIPHMVEKNQVALHHDLDALEDIFTIKSYIYSIFQNLIVNSIKYRKENLNPVIHINSQIAGAYVNLCFKDNGKGIDMGKYGAQIFGPYKRFDQSVEGKGLGLFMVKMQTERLGGKISVESEIGKGARFKITLPLNKRTVS